MNVRLTCPACGLSFVDDISVIGDVVDATVRETKRLGKVLCLVPRYCLNTKAHAKPILMTATFEGGLVDSPDESV